jgi:pimeloyl-ACP methyl ester carboxylesterase
MAEASIVAHYVTLPGGQVRLWRAQAGHGLPGRDLVVVAGLTLAASVVTRLLTESCPDWRITVFEMPGIGGSSTHEAESIEEIATALQEALEPAGIERFALATFDMAGAVAGELRKRCGDRIVASFLVGAKDATAWAARGHAPADLTPRQDGTQLTAMWAFVRDCHLLEPGDPTQPATGGEAIPDADDLDATVTAAAVRPERFSKLWSTCAAQIGNADGRHVSTAELQGAISALDLNSAGGDLAPTAPLPGSTLWRQYVETSRGRMHLRRAGGGSGRPIVVIPTGGGSSAQFEPVVVGLSEGGARPAIAVDYLGNGLSDKPRRDVTVATLAEDMAALIEALGFDSVDVWGSHTGSLVGIELAVQRPELVNRAVLEGPVFVSQDFQSNLLARYFPPFRPDKWGLHLQSIWNWRRDMFMFWPWYCDERAAARQLGVPSAKELHKYAIGILESGPTYDLAYRTAFSYDTAARLPLLKRPALVCAGPNDMLVNGVEETRRLAVPGVETMLTPTTVWWPDPDPKLAADTLAIYRRYLA